MNGDSENSKETLIRSLHLQKEKREHQHKNTLRKLKIPKNFFNLRA